MQIKMLASRFAAGGVLSYVAGSTYEVANDLALQFIGDNAAVEVNGSRTAATGTQRDEFNRGAEGQAGVSLVSADGILPRADTLFAVEKVQMTASGSPCAAPCLLHRIRCLVGTSIALVVYDNPFGTSGTELYSGTLSAGQEAVIATPVRAINGPRGVFTGTATFEYHVSQEV